MGLFLTLTAGCSMKIFFTKLLLICGAIASLSLPTPAQARTLRHLGPHLHTLQGVADRDLLILEDSSSWRAASISEAYTAQSWQPGETVYLSPNHNPLSSAQYPFYVNNLDRGSYVRVSPMASPIRFGPESSWIFSVNLALGQVVLTQNSGRFVTWETSASSYYTIREWQPHDHIVVGLNEGFFSFLSPYSHILINFDKGEFITAKLH